jgi:hypothetical protein
MLNKLVIKPALNSEPTKGIYFGNSSVRLTVPMDVVVESQAYIDFIDFATYSFKRKGQSFCKLDLSTNRRALAGAKCISVGLWQGIFAEIRTEDGDLTGDLYLEATRESWFSRLFQTIMKRILILRERFRRAPSKTEPDTGAEKRFAQWQAREFPFLHFSYSKLSQSDRDLVLEIAASLRVESLQTPPFTSTVDWYRPPPKDFLNFGQGRVEIPSELIIAVPQPLHEEAKTSLGEAQFVPLAHDRAKELSGETNPDAILQSLIKQREKKLLFFLEHPVTGFRGRELDRQKATRQRAIDELNSDIDQFRQWEHQLKPYLIKAVTLEGSNAFGGRFISEDLLIYGTALGSHPVPMKRWPVIAFLPDRPHEVYTAVGMRH